jgi:hypothetical protein
MKLNEIISNGICEYHIFKTKSVFQLFYNETFGTYLIKIMCCSCKREKSIELREDEFGILKKLIQKLK